MTSSWSSTRLFRVSDPIILYLAACVAFIELRDDNRGGASVAILAVGGFGMWLTHAVRTELRREPTPALVRMAVLATPLTLGAGLLWYWNRADRSDGWGFFGVATLYLGLGIVVSELRRSQGWSLRLGIRFLGASILVVVVSTGALIEGESVGTVGLVAGLLLAPVGISLLSAHFTREEAPESQAAERVALEQARDRRTRRNGGAGGSLFLGGLIGMIAGLDIAATYIAAFAVGLLVLVFALVSRSNADVVLVVVAVAVVALTGQQPAPLVESVTADPDDGELLVALGDSFMSGEGAPTFFSGTNTRGLNECRRAPTAYPATVVGSTSAAIPDDVVFVACSGAVARHLHAVAQHRGEPDGEVVRTGADGSSSEVVDGLPQMENVQWQLGNAGLTEADVKVVLVSIGGNDALFGVLVQTCVLPGSCAELGQAWMDWLEKVDVAVSEAYGAVRAALPETRVVVVPYPIPIERHKGDCGYSPFVAAEHEFLVDFTRQLNVVLERRAAAHGFYFLAEMETALEGQQLCDEGVDPDDAGVNFLARNGVEGVFEQEINPRNWFHNSMHPNERGHETMAEVVETWLEENGDLEVESGLEPSAEFEPTAEMGDECVGEPDLKGCAGEWARREMGRFLVWPGSLLAVMAFGAWLLALAVVEKWRALRPVDHLQLAELVEAAPAVLDTDT
ncbi:MAG TPA: SGNH/GDSL hydrolase family protein [Acidimicrobiales bacterium]